jgi:hypothetical protein
MIEHDIACRNVINNRLGTENKENIQQTNNQSNIDISNDNVYNYLKYAPCYNAVCINLKHPQVNVLPSVLESNINLGRNIIKEFYKQFPSVESSTLLDIEIMRRDLNNENSRELDLLVEKRDKMFDKYKKTLDKRIQEKRFSMEELIKDIKASNIANCGDRAVIVDDMLHKNGYNNTKIVNIKGNNCFNEHVFNVIGLDKNADITKPETWGENAVIIDAWANKTGKANDIIDFYKDFLLYNTCNQPMYFNEGT